MSFHTPLLLLCLAAVPLAIVAYVFAQRRARRYAVRFPATATVAAVLPSTPGWRRHVPVALFAAALAILIVALSRPEATVAVPV